MVRYGFAVGAVTKMDNAEEFAKEVICSYLQEKNEVRKLADTFLAYKKPVVEEEEEEEKEEKKDGEDTITKAK